MFNPSTWLKFSKLIISSVGKSTYFDCLRDYKLVHFEGQLGCIYYRGWQTFAMKTKGSGKSLIYI